MSNNDRDGGLPEGIVVLEEFGDTEALFNSREWLERLLKNGGAKITGKGVGMGQADLDFELEGCRYNISIKPRLV